MALLETGVASDVHDLLSRINTRLAAEGWTILKYDTTDTDVHELYISRLIDGSTRYFLFYASLSASQLRTAGATGFDGGQAWDNQPGIGTYAETNFVSSPIKQYKFFGGASYFYISIQKQTAIYGHAGIGVLTKCGTWVGGEFCFGTRILFSSSSNKRWDEPDNIGHAYPLDSNSAYEYPGSVRADTGFGGSVWHAFNTASTLKAIGQARRYSLMHRLRQRSGPNQFNGQSILLPAYCYVRKQVPEPAWLYAGYAPDLRFINVNGLNYEDNLVLGPDTWNTFPILQKNGATGQPNSGNYGIGYRVN